MLMNKLKKEKLNLSFFSTGMLISVLGSTAYTFAIGLYVLKLTNSGMNFAITLMSGLIASLIFNPIAGVVADRVDKKKLVIAMDLLNGIMFIFLFFMTKYQELNLIIIYTTTFLTTSLTIIFQVAFTAAQPQLVGDDSLVKINSVSKVVDSFGRIGGPVIGGMIFALVDIKLFILVNGISFFISALFEAMIDFNFNQKSSDHEKSTFNFIDEMKKGINYIKGKQELSFTIYLLIAINFFFFLSLIVPLPYILNQTLQLDPKIYGFVEAFLPIGVIVGAVVCNHFMKKFNYIKPPKSVQITLSIVLIAIGVPVLSNSINLSALGYLIYYSTLMFVVGFSVSFVDIPIMCFLQTEVPEELRGRVMSITFMGAGIINPIAIILSGILIDRLPSYTLPISGGILSFTLLSYLNIKQSYAYQSVK